MTTALLLKIGADASSLKGELAKANSAMTGFTNQMDKLGGVIAGAFAVGAIANFSLEAAKLAAEAEGVSSAFNKLPNSTKLLNDLRVATENTVDNLTLMKLGVSAFNNNVPIQNLAEILAFVDKTSDATGQSFKDLADTIINDIGKESTRGLNDMGLSIDRVKMSADQIGFIPAVLDEMRRKSLSLGDVTSDSADNFDKMTASIENLKIAWGNFVNSAGVQGGITLITNFLNGLANMGSAFDKIYLPWGKVIDLTKDATNETKIYSGEAHVGFRQAAKEGFNLEQQIKKINKAMKEEDPLDSITRKKYLAPIELKPTKAMGTLVDPMNLALQNFESGMARIKGMVLTETPIISGAFVDMSMEIQGAMGGLAIGFGSAIGDMLSGVGGIEQLAGAVVGGLGNMAVQLGQTMIQFGLAGLALKKFVTNPALAVAAGIGLVALGRALSNKASSISGGGGGGSGGGGSSNQGAAITKIQYGNRIEVTGEFELRGDTAVALIKNQQRRDDRTLPTRR